MIARHPSNPSRTYVPWVWKVQAQLNELRRIENPDIRTKGEIARLEKRLNASGFSAAKMRCSEEDQLRQR